MKLSWQMVFFSIEIDGISLPQMSDLNCMAKFGLPKIEYLCKEIMMQTWTVRRESKGKAWKEP